MKIRGKGRYSSSWDWLDKYIDSGMMATFQPHTTVGGMFSISVDNLSMETGISRRQVIVCTQDLAQRNMIHVARGRGRGKMNSYLVLGPEEWLEVPCH